MNCESAKSVDLTSKDCTLAGEMCQNRWNVTISGPACANGQNVSLIIDESNTNSTQMVGTAEFSSCGNGTDSLRISVLTALIGHAANNETLDFIKQTAIICSPSYKIQNTSLSINSTGQVLSFGIGDVSRQLPGVSIDNINDAIFRSVNSSAAQLSGSRFVNATGSFHWPDSLKALNSTLGQPFFTIMGFASPTADLTSQDQLQNAFNHSYAIVAAQLAKENLMSSSQQPLTGLVSTNERRLIVRTVSLRIMEVCCIVLALLCVGLFKLRPAKVTPRDTSTIGGLATVLSNSPGVVSCFHGIASASQKQIRKYLSGLQFVTVVTGEDREEAFSLRSTGADDENEADLPEAVIPAAPRVFWDPLPDWVRIMILGLSFVFITVLELMNQRSLAHDGITDYSPSLATPWIACFVPAIGLTILGGLFGIIDFYTRLVQPYALLKKMPSPARQTILVNHLSKITIFSIWDALSKKHIAVVLTAFSAFLAPFLVIFSGALYTGESVQPHPVLNISTISMFDTAKIALPGQNGLPLVSSLVAGNHTVFPAWTSDVYAFPELSLPGGSIPVLPAKAVAQAPNVTALNITIPALTASLNCTRLASETVKVYLVPSELNSTALVRRMAVPVPAGCGAPCRDDAYANTCDGNEYYYGVDTSESLPEDVGGFYFGHGARMPTNATNITSTNACPQFSIVYGQNSPDGETVENMVAMNCYPATYQVEVQAIFNIPSWTVQSVNRSLANQPSQSTGNPFNSVPNGAIFPDTVEALVNPNDVLPPTPLAKTDFDPWFGALFSRDGLQFDAFLGDDNTVSVVGALDRLYGRITAQDFNLNRRSPIPAGSAPAALNGSVSSPGRIRLKQDVATTRVLEVVLALMFVATAASFFFLDTRRVLPNNPCSIGVMATLIADSELVKKEVVPPGCEWCSDAELIRRDVFEGYMFSLGMWNMKGKGRKTFGINVGGAEKVE